jgi:phage shock protein A
MTDFSSVDNLNYKPKSFWKRPEGITGTVFLLGVLGIAGWFIFTNIAAIFAFVGSLLGTVVTLLVLGAIIYMVLDPKMRTLVSYMYKSVMRWVTGVFVTIDPIGILKNYIEDLQDNLKKMGKQIGNLRGQMRKLKNMVDDNDKEIKNNMLLARKAKEKGIQKQMLLSSRKAARLKETNAKYITLHKKIGILYKVLTRMYANSEILLEDTKDQVKVKEQERKAIRASHSAMKSAMNIISGNTDKRAMFDQAMEVIADDVANKVGEMEQFMELSSNFMASVDLQNGVFEEQGLKMLEEYEKKSTLLLLGGKEMDDEVLDLQTPEREERLRSDSGSYDQLFD